MEQEQRRAGWVAWHIAALSRAKRLPSLRRFLGTEGAKVLEGEELEKRRRERDELLAKVDVEKLNEVMRKRGRETGDGRGRGDDREE